VRNVYFTLFPGDPEKQIEYLNHHGQARYRDWQCVTMGEYVRFQGMVIHASQFSDCGLEMFQEGHPSKFGELMTFQKFCRIRSVYHLARVPSDTPYDLSLDPWLPERILEEETNKNRIENVGPPMTICMDETGIPCQPRARKDTGDGLHITQMVGKPAEFSIQEKNIAGGDGILRGIEFQKGKAIMEHAKYADICSLKSTASVWRLLESVSLQGHL
jgi:hypothetical protein